MERAKSKELSERQTERRIKEIENGEAMIVVEDVWIGLF